MIIPGIFSQRDGRWSGDVLGNNGSAPWIIYNYGCLIASISNMIWYVTGDSNYTPSWANDWLRNSGGFTQGGGEVIWSVLNANLATFNIEARGYTGDLNEVEAFLAPEQNFVLVWITKPGFPQHWAVMPYVGQIADPWDGKLKSIDSYTFRGAHLYSHVTPVVVTPPAPPVIEAPPQEVIVAPTVPVPSTDVPIANPNPNTEIPAEPVPVAWEDSYIALEQDKTIVRSGAIAEDVATGAKFADLPVGYTATFAGTFERDGVKYYRGHNAVAAGTWIGVASVYFDEVTGQTNGIVPIRFVATIKDDIFKHLNYTSDTFKQDVDASVGILTKLKELVSRAIARFIKRKGIS